MAVPSASPAPERPFHLSLVLGHACNLACGYCYMGEHHAAAMPARTAERAVLAALELAASVQVSFFGGEPLLAWDTLVHTAAFTIEEASRRGARAAFQVTTNGTLIDAEKAAALREMGAGVAVSIDGDEAAHDRGRPNGGGGSSFGRAVAGVGALHGAGVPFEIVAVVTPENVRELCGSVRFLDALRPQRVLLNPAWERAWSDADVDAWRGQLEGLAALWEERYRAGDPLRLPLFEGKLAAAAQGARGAECSVGRWNVAVAPSGNLYPCDRLVGEDRDGRWVVGHLDEGLVARRALARGHGAVECEPCAERFRCGASCACACIAETGEPDRAGGLSCWYEQTVAELADAAGWRLLAAGHEGFVRAAYGEAISGRMGAADVARLLARRPDAGGAQAPSGGATSFPAPVRRLPVVS